jgi:hypothetical protein
VRIDTRPQGTSTLSSIALVPFLSQADEGEPGNGVLLESSPYYTDLERHFLIYPPRMLCVGGDQTGLSPDDGGTVLEDVADSNRCRIGCLLPKGDMMSHHAAVMTLAARLRQLRIEVFGPDGLGELARLSGIPVRTWLHYESGVTIPGLVLLDFIRLTMADPLWLLNGVGSKFRSTGTESDRFSKHLMN